MIPYPFPGRRARGLTLVEVLVTIALLAVIISLAAPSMRRMIEMQRLRGVSAQLLTDIQLARSEAVARRAIVAVAFNSDTAATCYTIYVTPILQSPCDCRLGSGSACTGSKTEVRTVQVARSSGVTVGPVTTSTRFAFDPTTGGITNIPTDAQPIPIDSFGVDAALDSERKLRTVVNRPGRPQTCSPPGSKMTEATCP